jgi:hypothetical protein
VDSSAAWVTSVRANSQEFAAYVLDVPELLRGDRLWAFPTETVRAIRRRLSSDPAATELLLKAMEEAQSIDLISSILRLVGSVARDRELVRGVARRLLQRHIVEGHLSPYGYDMFDGATRPLQHSLLDACLM